MSKKVIIQWYLVVVLIVTESLCADVNVFSDSKESKVYKATFDSLRKIGETCKDWWQLQYSDGAASDQLTQVASIFMFATTNKKSNLINSRCLEKLQRNLESELSKEKSASKKPSEPNPILKQTCELTTRAIYGNNGKKGALDCDNFFYTGKHTEQVLFCYLREQGESYRWNVFKQCGSFSDEEEAKEAYNDKFDYTGENFDFYLYSYLSPCKNCLKEIESFAKGKVAKKIGITKTLVSYDKLYRTTTPEQIENLSRDKIQFWVTETELKNLQKKKQS